MRTRFRALFAVAASLVAIGAALAATAAPARAQVTGIMLQGWYWDSPPGTPPSWWNHLSELAPEMKRLGITGVWIPPPCKGAAGGYSSGYDVYDFYDLGAKPQMGTTPTKWGTKDELLDFVAVAHANGLDVYADIVPNHRSGGRDGGYRYDDLWGAEAVGRFTMAPWDFHQNGQGDWHMDLTGMRDIAQELPYVRDQLFRWVRWFDRQTGVDGYRIDAAKHMDPAFVEGLLYQVQEGSGQSRFAVSEYYDGNPYTLSWYIGATRRRTAVFDFTLKFRLHDMAHGAGYFDMRRLRERFWDDGLSVTFVNSHDTFERGNGLHTFIRANLAYAYIMAAPGYPCVYYKDLFDEHGRARDYLVNLMWIHHHFAKGPMIERWADDDVYVFEREGNLICGLNDNAWSWRTVWVPTSFGPGAKLHDYALGVEDRWTTPHGWVRLDIPPGGYVLYARDGSQGRVPYSPPRRTVQEWEGNADMDRPRLAESWAAPVRVAVRKGRPVRVELYLQDWTLAAHVAIVDRNGRRLNHARGVGSVKLEYLNPPEDGHYLVYAGLEQTGQGKRTPYWLKVVYEGPERLPSAPVAANPGWNLLPLVPSSVGP